MKRQTLHLLAAAIAAQFSVSPAFAQASPSAVQSGTAARHAVVTAEDYRAVSPALEAYARDTVQGGLWQRPDLSGRDRSIVTLAALIARQQTAELPRHVALALDNGVKAGEISELIAHLAFYAGWPNVFSALPVAKDVFANRRN